jgi:GT2 family glycosyltransferase
MLYCDALRVCICSSSFEPLPTLSIIIVTYNPGVLLLDCLASLSAGVGELSFETFVIDNASDDGIVQSAAAQFPGVQYRLNTDNRGFAAANNQGLAAARGEYLLLLNPDVVVKAGSLAALVRALEHNPAAGIVGPRTYGSMGKVALTARGPFNAASILWQYIGLDRLFPNQVFGRYRRAGEQDMEPFAVEWVQGSCLLIRRAVYEQIGGLDEQFFLFAEETDYCERAAQAGWKTYFVPGAEVVHHESSVASRYPERKIRYHHLSPLYYFRKRGHSDQIRWLKLGFTLELLLKMGIRAVQSIFERAERERIPIYWRVLREIWRY